MKSSNPGATKALFILLLVFMSLMSYGQLNFKDSNLAFLEKIAFVKYKDIEKVMKESSYELKSMTKSKFSHNFYFIKPKEEGVLVRYSPKKKLEAVSTTILYLMGILAEQNLEENNFIKTKESTGNRWRKSSYPFHFYVRDDEDMKKMIILFTN